MPGIRRQNNFVRRIFLCKVNGQVGLLAEVRRTTGYPPDQF
jgi:hypothetical protein